MFKATKSQTVNTRPLPKHIAIIMDGNGRYAQLRGLPRIKGHYEGMQNVKSIVRHLSNLDVKYLTLYAFSTENWSRPSSEVKYLLKLPTDFLGTFLPELMEKNVKVTTIGHFNDLPKHTKKAVQTAIDRTKDNTGLNLIFALNYGARDEIQWAIKNIVKDAKAGRIDEEEIDNNLIDSYLMTNGIPDPEMIIRTSGEYRLSNFLLWQSSYSELFFSHTLWPEFSTEELDDLIYQYQKRERRFGGLKEEDGVDED
ncbi:isoprenyl transferase [Jeotgalicoccus meleagridis]|uniref:Isoprenyl transferase n=1 Tax=Jeotgalicoccus meleagridis TaxID=2759181 RepID=A0A6V7RN19_9STAP|nr:isoprenyl transferase [Jeotgalicoccus meleagridis]CAD2079119.1 Ditrans,polycis-undecaprenyl-diphosphate synthase ((2E,6E)-farnesyl-diphosphate specific) [Jeotgalicoccus meleagridis]HIW39199.1 isoprenyl transferase [Candidatus Jeotgalicoccus stercoravium]